MMYSTMEHGYDIEMASGEAVETKFICPVCLSVMREAMQTSCGHRFCKVCITRVTGERSWGKCPVDKTIFQKRDSLFNDVAIRREILSLHVKCKNSSNGCSWAGELRGFEKHEQECLMENVNCPVGCGVKLMRGQIDAHREQCPQRRVPCSHCQQLIVFSQLHKHELLLCEKFPVTCKLCGESGILRMDIAKHVDSSQGTCPQANMSCKFVASGCHFQDKRINIQQHYDENVDQHMSLLMGHLITLSQSNDKLKEELAHTRRQMDDADLQLIEHTHVIEQLKERTVNGRMIWKLDLRGVYDALPNMVFSPPFYSSCPGYLMRVRLDFNGVRDGEEFYSSVFIVLQRGEFDSELLFPFNGQVKVSLLSQTGAVPQNVSAIIQCMEVPRNNTGSINARANSRGRTRFIKKSELFSATYFRNRNLFFEVAMVNPCVNCNAMNRTSVPTSPSSV